MALSQKISLSILIIAGLFMGFAVLLVFYNAKSALEKAIGDNQLEVTRQTMNAIDRVIYERILDIQVAASARPIQDLLKQDNLVSPSEVNKILEEFSFQTGPWNILLVADKSGIIIASDHSGSIGESISRDVGWVSAHAAALERDFYYSDFTFSGGKPVIVFSSPIINKDEIGKPVSGVMIGNFSWPVIMEILEGIPGDAHLYSNEGGLIGSSDPDENESELLRSDTSNELVLSALKKVSGSGVFESSFGTGKDVLASYVPQFGYLRYKGSGWRLIIETSVSTAFFPARSEAAQLAIVTAVTGFLAALAIFFIIRRSIVEPVVALTKIAEIISRGNLNERATVGSKDEIGKLAAAFNLMTEKLQVSILDLETERESIAAERNKLSMVLTGITDAVVAIDLDGHIIIFNNAAENIIGVSKNDAIGKPIDRVVKIFGEQSEIGVSTYCPLDSKGENKKTFFSQKNVKLVTPGKKDRFVDIVSGQIQQGEKVNLGCILTLHDVTREQLIEKMKVEFVSLAAHQLRTPLSIVKWSLRMFLDKADQMEIPHDDRDLLEKSYAGNERVIALVGDLLDAARIEEGRYVFKPARRDIQKILESVVMTEEKEIARRKMKLKVEKPKAKIGDVMGDEEALKLALQNVIVNAYKYSLPGGNITISLDKKNSEALITIKDFGIGIPKEDHERIFSKFFRGSNAVRMETEGSGLGLFITKNIIEAHNGKINFESKESGGSTFFITLPLLEDDVSPAA